MLRYVLKRLLQMLPMLLIVSVISFFIVKLAPGDPLVALKMNPTVSQKTIDMERQRLGLDQPLPVQYWRWVSHAATGDLGESYTYKQPVTTLMSQRVGNTLILGFSALILTWVIALPLGIYCAVRQYSWMDKSASVGSYLALGVPDYLMGLLLLMYAVAFRHFPVGGISSLDAADYGFFGRFLDTAHHLVLPAIAMGIGSIAILQRRMRGNLLDVLHEDYIRTARAKGLNEHAVTWRHAVRNAINPIVTMLGYELAGLLSGAAFVEVIFSWPGLGNMMLEAVFANDYNLVMAGLVLSAGMLMLGNLIADLLLAAVDPRIKLEA
jgi:peptide/nickel transport system permease protein